MPMLVLTGPSTSLWSLAVRRSSNMRSAIRPATAELERPGTRIANSSPPKRAIIWVSSRAPAT